MRQGWAAAVAFFAGVAMICATPRRAWSGAAATKAGPNGTSSGRAIENDRVPGNYVLGNSAGQNQGGQNAVGQDGNAPNGMGQNATGQAQTKTDSGAESSFLIARRELDDPLFGKAVILMLPVLDSDGVVGLIVNRPTKITLHKLFPKIGAYKDGTAVAYLGGPIDVKTAGVLFRSTKEYKQAFHLSGDLYVSFNSDVIEKVMKKPKEVTDARLFLGRSQWKTKQLAAEMQRGSWFGEKEANSVIFRRDSASVWIELIGELEPGNIAELEGRRDILGVWRTTYTRDDNGFVSQLRRWFFRHA
jgi:putative transcriptional regulator